MKAEDKMTRNERAHAVRAAEIIRQLIKRQRPDRWTRAQDATGERIHVHYDDGILWAVTLNFTGYSWNDYLFLDRINEALESEGLPFSAEYLSEYEVGLMLL